ncbi:MAG: choice-of-anchor Q domain-containing protein [Bacteroidota bacterium]
MKKFYVSKLWVCLLALMAVPFLGQAQFYVKSDATGAGDGSSWTDAYTDLQTALDSVPQATGPGDIPDVWVAAGIYKPTTDAADSSAVFFMSKPVNIYGGFAGTESMLSERDLANNVTNFSGDVNGDDVQDDFISNKSDNVVRVLWIDSLVTERVTLDGITISGGHASNDPDVEFTLRTGAGVYSWAPVNVDNCLFTGNYARRAGGMYLSNRTVGSRVANTNFNNNGGGWRSAGIYAAGSNDLEVINCNFVENQGVRGSLYFLRCNNSRVENCNFIDNVNITTFAGAYYNWNSIGTEMINCTFSGNEAVNGGCMYIDGRETTENVQVFRNCTFEDNAASNSAGTIYSVGAVVSAFDTEFNNNEGAAFVGNARFTTGGSAEIDNCTFNGNSCASGGAALGILFGAQARVTNSTFDGNEAGWGGAAFVQSDSTLFFADSCTFLKNTGNDIGGGAIFFTQGVIGEINNSIFESNAASDGPGGAIYITEDSLDFLTLDINNCSFTLNSAVGQGGVFNVANGDLTVTNSIFFSNIADEDDNTLTGRGGVLSNNASTYLNSNSPEQGKSVSDTSRVTMINNTFVENDGTLAGSIAQWEYQDDTLKANAYLTLQNNIFFYSSDIIAPHYAIEAGAPVVISRGGNLTFAQDDDMMDVDNSLDTYLTQSSDQLNTDPMMEDPLGELYAPMEGSPLIDAGVADGAPTTDINGLLRDDMPDIGAIEFDQTVSTKDLIDNSALTIAPNPTSGLTTLTLNNAWSGDLQLFVVDAVGKAVKVQVIQKVNGLETFDLDLSALPQGAYQIIISTAKEAVVKSMIKL